MFNLKKQSLTTEPVYHVVERILGSNYVEQLIFETIPREDDRDVFELENQDGKIKISGSSIVAMSFGLNWYLKYTCQVSISWSGAQLNLPDQLPAISEAVRKVRPYEYFYHMNYVTFAYSTVFWDWDRWEKELDWMALNGIDLVLELTGHEAVWRNMLMRIGYTAEEIKQYVSGPVYLPFQWLGCLYGWGGPLPDQWYADRLQLARQIHQRMDDLGMTRVMQSYTGIVPPDLQKKIPEANPIDQGDWVGLKRPAILAPDDPAFAKMAQIFYEEQAKLFGHDHFYAGDPFHEGGEIETIDIKVMAKKIQSEMLKADDKAVWVLQAWWENPLPELMLGLDREHTLILDLWGENTPRWKRADEGIFFGLPWAWSFLQNFGGRSGLYGDMDGAVNHLLEALHHPKTDQLVGMALTGEGIEQNPVMYDLITEMGWCTEIDVDAWLKQYVIRRYGQFNEQTNQAWQLLKQSAYGFSKQPGPTHSVINKRPPKANVIKVFDHNEQTKWDSLEIYYDPALLEKACKQLYAAFDMFKAQDQYVYDLVDMTRQAVANKARHVHLQIIDAYNHKDLNVFLENSALFLNLIKDQDRLLNTNEAFLVGPWLERAKRLGRTQAEKDLYEFNARALITIWAEPAQDILHDYGHKEWGGLTKDFYLPRWKKYLHSLQVSLETGVEKEEIDWFSWEYAWTQKKNDFPVKPIGNVKTIVHHIIETYL